MPCLFAGRRAGLGQPCSSFKQVSLFVDLFFCLLGDGKLDVTTGWIKPSRPVLTPHLCHLFLAIPNIAGIWGNKCQNEFSIDMVGIKGVRICLINKCRKFWHQSETLFLFDIFLSNVWKLVRSHHWQRNDIHYDTLQRPEITNLTSVQLILTNVRMKYLFRQIFSLKQ